MNTYDITDARYSAHPSPPPGATAYGQQVNIIGTVDSRAVSIMASLSGIQSANAQGGSAGVQAFLAPIMFSYAAQPLNTVWGSPSLPPSAACGDTDATNVVPVGTFTL